MVNAKDIQIKYIQLYKALRSYLWPMSVIEGIADLEIEAYRAFPDMQKLEMLINTLHREVLYQLGEPDNEIEKAFRKLNKSISDDSVYTKLYKVGGLEEQ